MLALLLLGASCGRTRAGEVAPTEPTTAEATASPHRRPFLPGERCSGARAPVSSTTQTELARMRLELDDSCIDHNPLRIWLEVAFRDDLHPAHVRSLTQRLRRPVAYIYGPTRRLFVVELARLESGPAAPVTGRGLLFEGTVPRERLQLYAPPAWSEGGQGLYPMSVQALAVRTDDPRGTQPQPTIGFTAAFFHLSVDYGDLSFPFRDHAEEGTIYLQFDQLPPIDDVEACVADEAGWILPVSLPVPFVQVLPHPSQTLEAARAALATCPGVVQADISRPIRVSL